MKNNRGITIITLLIMIIVIIVLASISTYTGINMINDAKESSAKDRLSVICNTILKDDSFLSFESEDAIELTQADFDYMNLSKYYSDEYHITIKRTVTDLTEGNQKITYHLVQANVKDSKTYEYDFDYTIFNEKYSYQPSFDETNGANRPIILQGMKPLMPDEETPVEDIYQENWYNYKNNPPIFAKMEYEGRIYMWIPRFAYNIQQFYDNRKSTDVPSSAISIIFLRENTNYKENNEVMDSGYIVHPAFGNQYCGFWMEVNTRNNKITLVGTPLYQEYDKLHLMTNSECGAALYLFHALGVDSNQIFNKDEYVAASLTDKRSFSSSDNFVDVYPVITETYKPGIMYGDVNGDGYITEADLELLERFIAEGINTTVSINHDNSDLNIDGEITSADRIILARHLDEWPDYATLPYVSGTGNVGTKADTNGGALYETPWDRFIENYPTDSKPYIIRKFSSGKFDYTNSDGTDTVLYRGVLKY